MSEITRTEKFLRACIDGVPCALKPLTRVEKLLAELNETLAGPAPTVILPETELTYDDGGFNLMTTWEVDPVAGGVYVVTYNGVEYECKALDASGLKSGAVGLGNTDSYGLAGGNMDAPFCLLCLPNESGGSNGAYGALMPLDSPESVTLSIVEKAETESEGIFTAHATITTFTTTEIELSEWNVTFETLYETYMSGRAVQVLCAWDGLIYRGRINVGGTMNDTKMLIMDVARGTLVPGYYTVALVDDGSGGVQSNLVGKVVGSD